MESEMETGEGGRKKWLGGTKRERERQKSKHKKRGRGELEIGKKNKRN